MKRLLILFLRWVHDYLHQLEAEEHAATCTDIVTAPVTAERPFAFEWNKPWNTGTGSPQPPPFQVTSSPVPSLPDFTHSPLVDRGNVWNC